MQPRRRVKDISLTIAGMNWYFSILRRSWIRVAGRLEAEGLVERVRGTGMRVKAGSVAGGVKVRQAQLRPLVEPLITRGRQLGLTNEQIISVIKEAIRE